MTAKDSTEAKRSAALLLLSTGQASPSEVAELAGTSRQLVNHWCKMAEIDWRQARANCLMRAWRKVTRA